MQQELYVVVSIDFFQKDCGWAVSAAFSVSFGIENSPFAQYVRCFLVVRPFGKLKTDIGQTY